MYIKVNKEGGRICECNK